MTQNVSARLAILESQALQIRCTFWRAIDGAGSGQMGASGLAAETGVIFAVALQRASDGLVGTVTELLAQERPTPMRSVRILDGFSLVDPTAKVRGRYSLSEAAIT